MCRWGPHVRRRVVPGSIGMAVREACESHLTDCCERLGGVVR